MTNLLSLEQRRALLVVLATRAARSGLGAETRAAVRHVAWLAPDCPDELRDELWRELVDAAGRTLPATPDDAVALARTVRRLQLTLVPSMTETSPGAEVLDSDLEPDAEEVAAAAAAGGPEPRSLVETVARLDRALSAGDGRQAARLIRALRAGAQATSAVTR